MPITVSMSLSFIYIYIFVRVHSGVQFLSSFTNIVVAMASGTLDEIIPNSVMCLCRMHGF